MLPFSFIGSYLLIVLCLDLEVSLWVSTYWANLWSLLAYYDVTAVRAAAENKAEVISAHARKIITERLAPALPVNDGKQTPMHGHAIFIAQHATACCCRGCLARWHGIPAGRELSEKEITCIADILVRWIKDQLAEAAPEAYTPPLF